MLVVCFYQRFRIVVVSHVYLPLRLQAASDVYSPVSGEVLEVNSVLIDEPAKVRSVICLLFAFRTSSSTCARINTPTSLVSLYSAPLQ